MPSVAEHLDVLPDVVEHASEKGREAATGGHVADYIPVLADADPTAFGIAISDVADDDFVAGDADVAFPIQSISKVFALVLAMRKLDDEAEDRATHLWIAIGREPSGDPFNSLVQLEHEKGVPRNPMINAGALVVDDLLLDFCDDANVRAPRADRASSSGDDIGSTTTSLDAERDTSHRNRAMANLMAAFGNITPRHRRRPRPLRAPVRRRRCRPGSSHARSGSSPTTASTRRAGTQVLTDRWRDASTPSC